MIPELVERGGGAIVNVSSDHVLNCGYPVPWPHDESPGCPWAGGPARRPGAGGDMDVYDATKWALNGLTLNWAWALRDRGVRVNGLCVGATDTPMMRGVLGGPGDGSSTPARPPWLLEPEQVASVLVELLEEGPSGRTGENVGVWPGHPARLTASSGPLRLGSPARAPGWA
ncbi:MAG: SDR family oxidoreductase [Acidimicrobiia bacterium]|nr:SDR family oxidoreductase [Acidimicrobiia bacterium]